MNHLLLCLLCISIPFSLCQASPFATAKKNNTKHIALIIASKGYQSVEYNATKRELMHAGFSVTTISTRSGYAYATDGTRTYIDQALNKFKYQKYDGVFIIGGPGAHTELDNETVYSIMRKASKDGKAVGAICYSPRILAASGILHGKHATGWNDDKQLEMIFNKYSVEYDKKPVVTDGTIITADGPNSAHAFGCAIVQLLGHKK